MRRESNIIRLFSFLTALAVFFGTSTYSAAAGEQLLTLEEAVRIGTSNSNEIYELEMEKFKTRIELYQAREALRDLRKKESTVRFSLPFNIKLPETHGQPKEIQTVFKIPELTAKIIDIDRQIVEARRKLNMDIRLQYLAVITEGINERNAAIKLEESEKALEMLERKFRTGQATKEAFKAKENEVKEFTKNLQQTVMAYEKEKNSLGKLIGMDVSTGYVFEEKLININIDRGILKEILDNTLKDDIDIYQAKRKLALATLKTETILMDVKKKFGSMASPVEQALRTSGRVDFDNLMTKYERMLDSIEDKYGGYYYIPFIFFVIPIPKEWFQREFDGIRYFDNEKFALPLSVAEKEKEQINVENVTTQQLENVENLYLNLVSAKIAFEESKAKSEELLQEYKDAVIQNKLGLITFEELDSMKASLRSAMDSVISNLISLNQQIYILSYESSGALEKYIGQYSITIQALENGESFIQNQLPETETEEDGLPGEWYTNIRLDDYKVAFGIKKLPVGVEATHYELYTYDGSRVGERTEINKEIVHLPVMFNDSALLRVKLYKDGQIVGEAELDGFETGGTLLVHKPSETNKFTGSWKAEKIAGTYKSSLYIHVDTALGATHYQVLWKNENISEILPVNQRVEHLDVVINDYSQLKVLLYKQEEKVAEAYLKDAQDGSGTLDIVIGN
jgi:hypothetical protein